MKNIIIGLTDPNGLPNASARYFARREDGDDYAFGESASEALASLEKRELGSDGELDSELAEEVAFLALGAADTLRTQNGAALRRFDGYIGVISEVIRTAPLLAKRWRQLGAGEFGGVWLYDVTERFGREWAEALLGNRQQRAEDLLECIVADES